MLANGSADLGDLACLDAGHAVAVTGGNGACQRNLGLAIERAEHAPNHAPIDGTNHRMVDDDIPERAVFGDDAELVAIALGVGSKPMSGEGVGDHVQC